MENDHKSRGVLAGGSDEEQEAINRPRDDRMSSTRHDVAARLTGGSEMSIEAEGTGPEAQLKQAREDLQLEGLRRARLELLLSEVRK